MEFNDLISKPDISALIARMSNAHLEPHFLYVVAEAVLDDRRLQNIGIAAQFVDCILHPTSGPLVKEEYDAFRSEKTRDCARHWQVPVMGLANLMIFGRQGEMGANPEVFEYIHQTILNVSKVLWSDLPALLQGGSDGNIRRRLVSRLLSTVAKLNRGRLDSDSTILRHLFNIEPSTEAFSTPSSSHSQCIVGYI